MGFKESFNKFFDISDDDMYEEQVLNEQADGQVVGQGVSYYAKNDTTPSNKIVHLQQRQDYKATIKVYEPRVNSDMKEIVDILLSNQAVVVNFSKCSDDIANKTINFVQGGIYAIDGNMERIGEKIFLCTPASIEIDGIDGLPD